MRDPLPGLSESEGRVTGPIKLLFDENIGQPIARHVAGILSFHPTSPPIIDFVVRKFGPGALDKDWVPKIASEGWVVISCDRALRCGGEKLPDICAAYHVTLLLFSTHLHQKKQFEKAIILLQMWNEVERLKLAARGSQFTLMMRHKKLVVAPRVRRAHKRKTYPRDGELRLGG